MEEKNGKTIFKTVCKIAVFLLAVCSAVDFVYAVAFNNYELVVPYVVHTVIIIFFFFLILSSFNKCLDDKFKSLSEFLPLFIFVFFEHIAFLKQSMTVFWVGTILALVILLLVISRDLIVKVKNIK